MSKAKDKSKEKKQNAAPRKSTQRLTIGERLLGRRIELLPGEATSAEGKAIAGGRAGHDLLADLVWEAYSSETRALPEDKIPPERAINARILKWLRDQPSFTQSKSKTTASIAASTTAARLLFAHLTTDEALAEALKLQEEIEEAQQQKAISDALDNDEGEGEEGPGPAAAGPGDGDQEGDQPPPPGGGEKASSPTGGGTARSDALTEKIKELSARAHEALDGLEDSPIAAATARSAMKETTEKIDRLMDSLSAWGINPGDQRLSDPDFIEKLDKAADGQAGEVAELAARVKGIAQQTRRTSVTTGTIPTNIGLTHRIDRLIPSEIMQLSPKAPAMLRNRKTIDLFNHGLLGKVSEQTEETRGPIMVMIDRSSSMMGQEMTAALAFGYGLAMAARTQGRPYVLATFNTRYGEINEVTSADNYDDHQHWISQRASGGTDFDYALSHAMDHDFMIQNPGADLLFVTDGECGISPDVIDRWQKFAERQGGRLLAIKTWPHPSQIDELADDSIFISDLMTNLDELARRAAQFAQ